MKVCFSYYTGGFPSERVCVCVWRGGACRVVLSCGLTSFLKTKNYKFRRDLSEVHMYVRRILRGGKRWGNLLE